MPALTSKRASAALGDIRREFDQRRKFAAAATGRIVKKSSALSPIPSAPAGAAAAPIPRNPGAAIQKSPVPAPIPRKAASKRPSVPTPRAPAIAYLQLGEAPQRCTAPNGNPTPFSCGIQKKSPAPIPHGPANPTPFSCGIQKKSPAPIPHGPAGAAFVNQGLPARSKPAEAASKKSCASPPLPARSSSAPISPATPPLSAASKTINKGSTVLVRTRVGALPTGMGLVLWLSAVVVSDAAEDGYYEVMYNGDFPRDDPFRTVRVARNQQ